MVVVVVGMVVGVRVVYRCNGRCRSPIDGGEGIQRIDRDRRVRVGLGSQNRRGGGISGAWRRAVNWESSGVLGSDVGRGGGGGGGCR